MPPDPREEDACYVPFGASPRCVRRAIAEEVAVAVSFATVPFAVMMMSPADLEDFAVGFSLSEGVIETAEQVRAVRVEPEAGGLRLVIQLAPARLHAHLARTRALVGRTGCGVCGIEDIASLPQARPRRGRPVGLSPAAVARALASLPAWQPLNRATGAAHAAAFAAPSGELRAVREDVGRHNALDKLAGAVLRAGFDPADGFVLLTSRCSFEMVEKAAALGAGALVAISAPTSLALARARAHDITLAGIARPDGMTVFHGAARIGADPAPTRPARDC